MGSRTPVQNKVALETMPPISLSPQEGALLTSYAQAKVSLETFVVIKINFEDLPVNRRDVTAAIRTQFPNISLTSLSGTTCSTLWILGVENKHMKMDLLEAGSVLVKDKSLFLLDFKATNIIELQLHRIAFPITDADVKQVLTKWGKILDYKIRYDEDGLPTGDRWVRLEAAENIRRCDLPESIRIKGVKGFMTVKGNDPTCTRCHKKGHVRRNCNALKCTKCRRIGHATEDCRGRAYASFFQPNDNAATAIMTADEVAVLDEVQDEVHGDPMSTSDPPPDQPVTTSDTARELSIPDKVVEELAAAVGTPKPPRGLKESRIAAGTSSPKGSAPNTPTRDRKTSGTKGKPATSQASRGLVEVKADPDTLDNGNELGGKGGSTAVVAGPQPSYSPSAYGIGAMSPIPGMIQSQVEEITVLDSDSSTVDYETGSDMSQMDIDPEGRKRPQSDSDSESVAKKSLH